MVQASPRQKLTFDQFLEQYPDGQGKYELVNGEILEMRAIRWHDDIADFFFYYLTVKLIASVWTIELQGV